MGLLSRMIDLSTTRMNGSPCAGWSLEFLLVASSVFGFHLTLRIVEWRSRPGSIAVTAGIAPPAA